MVQELHTARCEGRVCLCEHLFGSGGAYGLCACMWRVYVHFCVCSLCSPLILCMCVCVCLSVCVCRGVWPPSPCLSHHRERLGVLCVCVCVFHASSIPSSDVKGPGLPLFFGAGAQEHVGRICMEPLSPLHPHVIL